jgi:hypothetical protein
VVGGDHPAFLLRGGGELRVGPIAGAVREFELRPLRNGDRLKLTVGGQDFRLRVTNPHRLGDDDMAGTSLELVSNDITQVLYSAPEGASEPAWKVLWAGDLDGDGKPDLYVQVGDSYNVSERILFVSSKAATGELVGKFAAFRTVGS